MTAISLIGSTGGGATNGGNVALTYPSPARGNVAVVTVCIGTGTAPTLAVVSSSGGAGFFTQIVSTIRSSNHSFGVFRRVISSPLELGCRVNGNGLSTSSVTAVLHMFANVDRTTPEDVTPTSTNGASTTPDSPSITVASCGCAIVSAIGLGLVSAPTAPSSFLNSQVATGADTVPASAAAAWITNASTAAFNPTTWTSTSQVWISATIALRRAFGHDTGGSAIGTRSAAQVQEQRRVVVKSY